MVDWIARKFGMPRDEAMGAMVLATVALVCMLALAALRHSQQEETARVIAAMQATVGNRYSLQPHANLNMVEAQGTTSNPAMAEAALAESANQLLYFDPNTASAEVMEQAGLPRILAERTVKFRSKGFTFRKKEDMLRIYGLNNTIYQKVEPAILINSQRTVAHNKQSENQPHVATRKRPAKIAALDVNTADSAALEALPGIGDKTAHSLIKYRQLLGGYVHLSQLYELYYQDSTRTAFYMKNLYVAADFQPRKLRINTADQQRLYHPYLPKASTRLIAAYIREHGYLQSVQEMVKNNLIDAATAKKMAPYLSFD